MIAFLILLCGCVDPALELRYKPDAKETVRIGVLLPLSGTHAERGKMMLNGARFAAEELNSRRGHFGRRVDLVVVDTGGTEEGAAAAFKSAVAAGAVGVTGGYSTLESRGMTELAAIYRVPLVIAMATGNDDEIKANRFVYRVVFTDKQQAEMIAGYLHYFRRVKRLAIAVSSIPEEIFSRNVARDVAEFFRDLGGDVTIVGEVDEKSPDTVLKNMASTIPDAILLPFEGRKAAVYYKKLRNFGFSGLICGPDSWDDPAFFAGLSGINNFGNNFYTAFYSPESKLIESIAFRDGFRKKRYYYPGSYEVQAFDAVNMLLIGLGKDASDLTKFDKNWRGIRKHAAGAGVYTMLKKNQIDRTIYINKIGQTPESGSKLVPRNITGLQYSRLKVYDVDNGFENQENK